MAQVIFNPEIGVTAPSTEEIRADIGAKLQECFKQNSDDPLLNIEPSSPMGQFLDLMVAEIEAKNSEIIFLANMANPNLTTGKFLDALAALYGIDRKISEPTVVVCEVRGLQGTFIPYGAIVQDSNENKFRHSASAGVLIPASGVAITTFSAIEHGALEVGANSVTKIVTSIAGWDSVNNPTAGIVGRIEETDSELRTRMIDSYAINATGYVEAIEANLSALDGVLDARVLENPTNQTITSYGVQIDPHSILISIVGGDDEKIAETIYRRKDVGCGTTGNYEVSFTDPNYYNATYTYNIVRPESQALKIKITFFGTSMNPTEQKAVIQAVIDDVNGNGENGRVTLASTLYASRFFYTIQNSTAAPVANVQISLGDGPFTSKIEIPANVEPTIDENDVTIQFTGS